MMRDWYAIGQLSLLPLLATLLLHGAVLAALVLRWQADQQPRTIEARVVPPTAISATLIDAASLEKKKAPSRVKKAATPAPKTPSKPAPVKAAPSREITRAETTEQPPEKTAPVTSRPAPPEPEVKRISEEELAALSRAELADALDAEDALTVAVTAEQMSASYAALIRETVTNYWTPPLTARNGMEVLLAIQLVPTGEVIAANVLRSSGDGAFDRSAVTAVKKAASFPELRNLPRDEFERTFRRFRLLFRPEDLRY